MSNDPPPLTLAELERWLLFGGTARPLAAGGAVAIVELCTCTGELVERRACASPEVMDRVMRPAADGGPAGL